MNLSSSFKRKGEKNSINGYYFFHFSGLIFNTFLPITPILLGEGRGGGLILQIMACIAN
jgi:hypothetical protein